MRHDEEDAAGLEARSDFPKEIGRLKQVIEHVDHDRRRYTFRGHVGGSKKIRADRMAQPLKIGRQCRMDLAIGFVEPEVLERSAPVSYTHLTLPTKA